tara:strand:- start:380 stop:1135 length:756 start_codon:yes stop_codon:yes gene_type:complete
MNESLYYLILFSVGFVASIVNTLAGGGSLLTLPVLIFLGLPSNVANGTNRILILINSIVGTAGYKSKGVSTYPFNIYLGISALFGALIGAEIAIGIKAEIFNRILSIVMIIFGLIILLRRNYDIEKITERITGRYFWISVIAFFFIGIYGGFINAGIGIVIVIFLNSINRMTLIRANATKVALISIYTIGALVLFAINEKVDWVAGLWMAGGSLFGAWWSSRWSVKKGDNVIKIAMLIMVSVMSVKLWFFS